MNAEKKAVEPEKPDTGNIDWNEVRRRLERTQNLLNSREVQKPAAIKKILRERAGELSREDGDAAEERKCLEVLEFILGYEKYGIESTFVAEVYKINEYTPLPGTLPFVLGIINLRGRIISVIDLKRIFELPDRGLSDLDKVIVLRNQEMEFGILADVILGVVEIPLDELLTFLPTLTGVRQKYLKGVTGERVVVLDAERLLEDKSILVQEEVNG